MGYLAAAKKLERRDFPRFSVQVDKLRAQSLLDGGR
jgi:hypothetical protein